MTEKKNARVDWSKVQNELDAVASIYMPEKVGKPLKRISLLPARKIAIKGNIKTMGKNSRCRSSRRKSK